MLGVNVQGGTNAGFRNPFQGDAMPWQCECFVAAASTAEPTSKPLTALRKTNPGHLASCSTCRAKRPHPTSKKD